MKCLFCGCDFPPQTRYTGQPKLYCCELHGNYYRAKKYREQKRKLTFGRRSTPHNWAQPSDDSVEWRDIPDCEGRYKVSSDGRVFSCVRDRELTQRVGTCGYKMVSFRRRPEEKLVCVTVHGVVAAAFHGKPPSSKHQVHHKNEDRLDNRIENLEYIVQADHLRLHGKSKRRK